MTPAPEHKRRNCLVTPDAAQAIAVAIVDESGAPQG